MKSANIQKKYFITDICEPDKNYIGTIFEGKLDTPLSYDEWAVCLEDDIKVYCGLYDMNTISEHFFRSISRIIQDGQIEINGMLYSIKE